MPAAYDALRLLVAVRISVRAEDSGEANPLMPGAQPQALARHEQSPGLFVSGLSPPPGLSTGLLLYFPDSLPRHPRLAAPGLSQRPNSRVPAASGM